MKNVILVMFFIIGVNTSFAQDKCIKIDPVDYFNTEISLTMLGGNRGYSIYVKGDLANKIENYYNLKSADNKHSFTFKNVSIPNIDNTYKINIKQGYHGYDNSTGHSYFHTYAKGVHTQKVVNNFSEYEKEGIIIYFYPKHGKTFTRKQAEKFIEYYKEL